jgi:hypothetical protein
MSLGLLDLPFVSVDVFRLLVVHFNFEEQIVILLQALESCVGLGGIFYGSD